MQVKALKTFNGRLGLIRAGTVITVDDRYGKQLINNKLAEKHAPAPLEPESNTDLGGPPSTKDGDLGNDDGEGDEDEDHSEDSPPGDETKSQLEQGSGSTESSSAGRRAGGRAKPLSSQQVGRRSRKRT